MISALFDLKGMKIVYGKTLSEKENQIVNKISLECGILKDTARLLLYREIDTVEKAKRFLSPGKHAFHDPYLLDGMLDAVKRIEFAVENKENVVIFGDYDADGICATTVLYYCLKEFGLTARTLIPEREDGYGINLNKVKNYNSEQKIDLLITVDCGISDYEKIEELKKLGIEVIVTDHHEPPEVLPNCIKINPKLKGQNYPFDGLCGAGVAYKLGTALIGEKADKYLDFVSLATVADSMDLVDENRDIVVEGLKLFNFNKIRPVFKYMLGDNNRQVTAQQTLAYTIAPRINAGGRMGDANCALRLFLTENENDIFDLTAKLNEYNIARQVECDRIYREANAKIRESNSESKSVILVGDESWSAGFVGIVAAKLVEDYCRPVIVFGGHDDFLKGSARSIEGLNIYDAICSVKDLLIGFGGHSQAAGVSVSKENFEKLDKELNEYLSDKISMLDTSPKIYVDWNIEGAISMHFAREIELLEPFGVGNKKPLFSTCVNSVIASPLKIGSPHYFFKTETVEMLDFNGESDVLPLSLPVEKKIVFELNLSVYKNRESLKGYARHVLPDYGDFTAIELDIFENNIKTLLCNEPKRKAEKNLDYKICLGHRTLYVVSDPKNLKNYNTLSKIPVNMFVCLSKNFADCVVVSPNCIPEGYEKIVYLDKPMQELDFKGESVIVSEDIGYKVLDKVSINRSDFAKTFETLKNNYGKTFVSASDFYHKHVNDGDGYNFVFATIVFIELGIFKINNGILTYDEKVRNPLTNSKVYSKICILKG